MAAADYYLCDVCSRKVFYDSGVEYEFEDMPSYGVGDMACICKACSSQYEIKIVKRKAEMSFVREERYIVVKLKQLDDVDEAYLRNYLEENSIKTTCCVVVEKGWPEYEKVWSMIEQRVKKEKKQ